MQFNAVLGKLLPALCGKENLMLMGIFTYLADTTPEKDRTFRFGIFATFVQILPIVFVPFAGVLHEELQYISEQQTFDHRCIVYSSIDIFNFDRIIPTLHHHKSTGHRLSRFCAA